MKTAIPNKFDAMARVVLIALLVLIGTALRFSALGTHFSQIDDHGVAKTIKDGSGCDVAHRKVVMARILAGSSQSDFLVRAMSIPLQSDYLVCAMSVPLLWTYAPLQYFITALLVHPTQDYRSMLFWGRFPSFLFSVLAFGGLILFFAQPGQPDQFPKMLLGLGLMVFSWESIIYANQMSSFAIGVFFLLGMLVSFVRIIRYRYYSLFSMLSLGFFYFLCVIAQYQLIFLVPAFYLSMFFSVLCDGEGKPSHRRNILLGGVLYGILVLPVFVFLVKCRGGAGVHWNAGPEQQFLFNASGHGGLTGSLFYAISFFFSNGFTVFKSNLSFVSTAASGAGILYGFLGILGILGLLGLLR
ncbi:MAG: hypothetical protein WCS01_12535, partial [bacterium]